MTHIVLYTDMAGIYGAEQCTHALSLALSGAGYQVTVVQPYAEHHLVAERESKGITHRWLAPDNLWDYTHPARALTDRAEPERILAALNPDLVVFSDGAPVSSLSAKEVAAERGIPYLTIVHCVTASWAMAFSAHLPRLPEAFRRATGVIAVSKENLDLLHACFGLPAELGCVIHNGRPDRFFVEPSAAVRVQLREELQIPQDAVVCITVGRFDAVKGYQYQFEAFRILESSPVWPALHFVWVGGGPLETRLRQLTKLLKVDRAVHVLSNRDDVPVLLDAADIFVLPSQFEGMPLAVLEAMAKGLPVIATAVSGIPEALGDSGWLLPNPRQNGAVAVQLAEAIACLAMDEDRRKALGRQCRDRAQALFREAPMMEKYLHLIQRALVPAR